MTNANIKLGNCLDIMPSMNDESIDLTVTSPPYDNLRTYNDTLSWNFDVFTKVASELFRVTKPGGIVVWVVGDSTVKGSESGTSFRQALHFKELGFNLHDTMIFQKDNPPPVGGHNRYYQNFEYMFVLSKGKPATFSPITRPRRNKWNDKRTERIKSFNRDAHGNFQKRKKVSLTGDVKEGNVWKYIVGGGNSIGYHVNHPATFPEKLAHDHIISWSQEGDVVFDPFMGSGTTGKMALLNNRKFIGCELVEEYYNVAVARMASIDK